MNYSVCNQLIDGLYTGLKMIKNFIHFLLIISCTFSFISCSSGTPEAETKLLTFDIYDQTLETILETVAERYDVDLDFDVDNSPNTYSLSVINASLDDILKKLEADTGFFMKVVDEEILVEAEMIDESMTEITLNLNDNLWKDIRTVSSKVNIDEVVVKNFFGPLFSNILVTDVSAHSKTIELYLPKTDVEFIQKSLLYLNYLKQRRNLAITVFVSKKELAKKFLDNSAKSTEAEFAWKMNAGDNIVFTDDKGNKVDLSSQLLSSSDNIATSEIFLKLKFNNDVAENNFNFSDKSIQSIPLSDKLSLIVKSEWYTSGLKVSSQNLSSKVLAKYQKQISDKNQKVLNSVKSVKVGESILSENLKLFKAANFSPRIISLTSSVPSDISQFKIKNTKPKMSLQEILNTLPSSGVLIDCQGTIRSQRNIEWQINGEKLATSYYSFMKGAFVVDKKGLNKPVVYLPSANAIVGYTNSNILK